MFQKALFRCDGDDATGLGHLSRSLALAEALEEVGWAACFLGNYNDVAATLIRQAGFSYEELHAETGNEDDCALTIERGRKFRAAIIILDSYKVDPGYAVRLRREGNVHLVIIDDFAAWSSYPADVVLNFTLGASERQYPFGPARLLLGPQYLLVRRKLRRVWSLRSASATGIERICIALSGDWSAAKTLVALRILGNRNPAVEARVVLARELEDNWPIEKELNNLGAGSRLVVQAPDLAQALLGADIAICTGGLVKYEAAYLGAVPAIVSNGPREAADTARWIETNVGFDLGLARDMSDDTFRGPFERILALDHAELDAMRRRGQTIFSGDPTLTAAREMIDGMCTTGFSHG